MVLCGKAVNNQGLDVQLEGFNNVAVDNTLGKFGGTDDADNSGVVVVVGAVVVVVVVVVQDGSHPSKVEDHLPIPAVLLHSFFV